ncbi:hypothetical protein FNW02_05435 [Komarekiella sp. 'clone 1']|uniref:Uncharacterized protein n=1 Tax=Komarekiella delphini-convector SJRDD-AB1 TaxID=2593771 RepID=A0AA40VPI2_9NOST|nr:hypothetical protein [Komarekiella delphini-convector SJRDD-AB1]
MRELGYWGQLYSCRSLGAVYYLFTAYTERAFLQHPQLFKQPLSNWLLTMQLLYLLHSLTAEDEIRMKLKVPALSKD